MTRAERLLELIQNLRGRRYVAPGRVLAGELGMSLRTLYRDLQEVTTRRVIWPFSLAFYHDSLVVAAWCEARNDFRHFRVDRVSSWTLMGPFPRPRDELVAQWRLKFGVRPDWTADTF